MNPSRTISLLVLCVATACGSSPSGSSGGSPSNGSEGGTTAAGDAAPGTGDDAGAVSGDAGPPPPATPSDGGSNGVDGPAPAALQVTFLTQDSRQFVSATGGGGAGVTAQASVAGAPETFTVTDLTSAKLTDGDSIQLATADGDYWSAAGGGGGSLTADAKSAGIDQTFVLHRIAGPGSIQTGDLVSIETKASVSYVSATNGGGADVEANAPWAKGWESFWITIVGHSRAPNPAKQKVLDYLASIQGQKTVAGQHDKNNATPTDATDQVTSITGRAPGLWSADFGFGDGDVAARPMMIAQAQTEWTKGSIVQLMYHACAPTGDESCSWDDIGGATPASLTDAQWSDLVTDGGTLNAAWKGRLDTLSAFFAQLQAAGVAPLFRPEHEMNQGVFWWGGRSGPTGTARLFQLTHDYLVGNKGFDNIIWVWDLQDFSTLSSDVTGYYPGDAYFDIKALDVYDGGYDPSKYATMQGTPGSKLMAIGECSTPPTSAELMSQPDWVFFMLWPDFVSQNQSALPALYQAPNVVTLPQMPGW
jgi:hypothetical protein